MKAYSIDLRERVAAACAAPQARIYQVAAQFSVSVSFVDKLLQRQRRTGSLAALPARGGPVPRLDPAGEALLRACLVAQPDATLAELGTALHAAEGPVLSRTSTWRAVERLGWGRKKKASTPPSATPNGS
ncbi:hypothetical protein [Hymenobacter sp. IS2118]|uniref:hypothetical protein n=1 Tax=Hymenobacter sp. IS2118 TaxID=1505605 RepID=UPI00068EDEF6|nr:hypothetical protein [Hymenobacter sp. IS2118]